jgi:hypothetical protein
LTEVRDGDVASGAFGGRLRLPQLQILEGVIDFEDVEKVVDRYAPVNIFDGESF